MFEKGGKLGNMKKSKLAIGLMSALLSVGALAACGDVTYSKDGVILTYNGVQYTADQLFTDEFQDSKNYQTVFDAVYKLVVKNYFDEEDPDDSNKGKAQLASLKNKAETAVEGDKDSAQKKAESNGTSYDTEFDAILKEKGCEDETELYEKYLYQYKEETFNENFNNIEENMRVMKNGTGDNDVRYQGNKWNGYFNDKVPYHLSHILVKITDSSSTNYSNAKLSEDNAKKLARVAQLLKDGTYGSFGDVASKESDDSAVRGDLGVVDMSKASDYINEFKFAVYAYENLYGNKKANAQDSKITIRSDKNVEEALDKRVIDYKDSAKLDTDSAATEFATIPYAAFQIMESNAKRTTDADDQKVNEGNEDFYPRNVFFNHYFNRHSFALVTPKSASKVDDYYAEESGVDIDYVPLTDASANSTGFHTFTAEENAALAGQTYLATRVKLGAGAKYEYRPILVVRGGSGSGDSGYQGIHFIVVNRSPFEYVEADTVNHIASRSDYFTTYYPKESKYPTYNDGEKDVPYQTYVNFSGNEDDYKTRAEDVKSAINSNNPEGLKYFKFRKYLKAGKLSFKDASMQSNLETWMKNTLQNSSYNNDVEWENSWISYIENLKQAKRINSKKIDKACAIKFSSHTGSGDKSDAANKEAWTELGGLCNDGEQH